MTLRNVREGLKPSTATRTGTQPAQPGQTGL
jgi:hypothetical protein